ncbi:hypothetical protein PC9H_011449 [Pleurotus ostreatus]|uniref:Uncharacterized protein n=1 Tax=Pleurotus ostreatus TaxID=5322 RepID=A0A8H6ZLI2_PLEOS|nr:uncharacterized protein PC9H_011449 [Pleurotus ostreatus]KAF7420930.1 hypothetical protein PC9H_011449 [Pleurotus ostreatus]
MSTNTTDTTNTGDQPDMTNTSAGGELPLPKVPTLQRGWAKGTRLTWLTVRIQPWKEASLNRRSRKGDILAGMVNKYFTKYPWRLPVTDEPSNQNPDPYAREPVTAEEKKLKGEIIKKMTASIQSWLDYRISSVHRISTNNAGTDPFAMLLNQFIGMDNKPSRLRTGDQMFSKAQYEGTMKADFEKWFNSSGINEGDRAAERAKYVKARFLLLPPAVQDEYTQSGLALQQAEKESIREREGKELQLTPAERQDLLDRVADFFGPLLTKVSTVLGMHLSLLIGGPEPAHGGQLNVLSLHIGTNKAPIPQRWNEACAVDFGKVTDLFTAFLQTCYSPEECEAAAILGTAPLPAKQVTVLQPAHKMTDPDQSSLSSKEPQDATVSKTSSKATKRVKSKRRRAGDDSESTAQSTPSEDDTQPDNHIIFKRHPLDRRPKKKKVRALDEDGRSPLRRLRRHQGSEEPAQEDADEPLQEGAQHVDEDQTCGTIGEESSRQITPISLPPETDMDDPSTNTPISLPPETDMDDPSGKTPTPLPSPAHEGAWADEQAAHHGPKACDVSAIPSAPPASKTWPKWFLPAYSYLLHESEHLGTSWACILHALVNLEADNRFENQKAALPNVDSCRPSEIGLWIKNARVRSPAVLDILAYEASWWRWWRTLQPEWRKLSTTQGPINSADSDSLLNPLQPSNIAGSFVHLDRPGANGFLSVVGSLRWWGDIVHSQFDGEGNWLEDPTAKSWNQAVSEASRLIVSLWLEKGGEQRQKMCRLILGPYGAIYARS